MTPDTATMTAIGLWEFGGPEVLKTLTLPAPHAGTGTVRVRVRAAGINPTDVMLRDGRLAEYFKDAQRPFVPGMDIAGTIDELGPDVDPALGLSVGDDVIGVVDNRGSYGGYSQFVVLDARSVAPKPATASFAEAASFPMNALTARAALDALALPPGATLLVTGAAGAFGGYVVQLAAAEGVHVIALVGKREDAELATSFGAQDIIVRGGDPVADTLRVTPGGVDALADGAVLNEQIYPAIRDGGHIAAVIGGGDDPGRGIHVHHVHVRERATDNAAIARLARAVDDGSLSPRVAGVYPATDAVAAHRRFDHGGLRGRLILTF